MRDKPKALVGLHGAGLSGQYFSSLQALGQKMALPSSAVILPDLPGHGHSLLAPLDTISALSDWFLAQWKQQNIPEPALLIGHSMGSLLALEFAARRLKGYPKIAGLILIGFSYPMTVSPDWLAKAKTDAFEVSRMMNQFSYYLPKAVSEADSQFPSIHMERLILQEKIKKWTAKNEVWQAQGHNNKVWSSLNACHHYAGGVVAMDALTALNLPILIINGAHDKMTPPKNVLPLLQNQHGRPRSNITTVLIEKAGHGVIDEQEAEVSQAIVQWTLDSTE